MHLQTPMRNLVYTLLIFTACFIASCSHRDAHYNNVLDQAESLLYNHKDSAMTLLASIEPTELTTDSLRAKYYYLQAWGHMRQNRSMIADSLITFAHDYYRGGDVTRDMRSGTACAWYKFWVGDTPGAIAMLDSLCQLQGVPDSLMKQTLRVRSLLGAAEYQGVTLIPIAKRLMSMETDEKGKVEAKYVLVSAYEYAGKMDSALLLTDEIIGYARDRRLGGVHFQMCLERAMILTELGRYAESEAEIDHIFDNSGPDNGAADHLHLFRAINALNTGDVERAAKEIAIADSLAVNLRQDDASYFRNYSNLLHTMIDFKRGGKFKLEHVNGLNNRQREQFNRMKASQWESERGAVEQQSRALALKAESQRKTLIILVIALVSVLMLAAAALIIRHRRQRELENEERVEALQKMVDELQSSQSAPPSADSTPAALRRAMLQQLGIIKMVAETPTEQNREMLRKISSIESDTAGELVNWDNVFDLINNLYGGFYDKIHARFGHTLVPKEEQIIVLMLAGFSTKEISVITSQSTATIYVRKSSIRKKLGVPEKEDIVRFLT